MNFRSQLMVGCAGWMLSAAPLLALTPAPAENPYEPIVTRNMFGLVPIPVHNPADDVPATPLPKITPNGIMTIFGKVQVLFKVQATPQPGQPPKEVSYTMGEGERQDEIEVQKIDEQAATITFDNHGTVQTLELNKTITPAAAPAPAMGGGPRGPGGMPSMAPSVAGGNPAPAIGFGGRFGRNRGAAAAANTAASAGAGGGGAANPATTGLGTTTPVNEQGIYDPSKEGAGQPQLTPEQQILLIEAQRQKLQEENSPLAPLMPPTQLTDGLKNEQGGETAPQ